METLKFKVGDKVRVKSLEWYNQGFTIIEDFSFTEEMALLCGKIVTIDEIREKCYLVKESDYYWQDWMFEDKVITEEKQEIEQIIKNETKEMTQKEALEFLKYTKILCTSTEETVKVQVKLLELGVEWLYEHKGIFKDRYLLFINEVKKLKYTADISIWVKDINRQIEPNEILAIKIKEEKPKFDPKTLQPFDKVLVKENDKFKEWFARFFEYYSEGAYYTTTGTSWRYCIPYNEETKHLHGTTEDAPEFYRI